VRPNHLNSASFLFLFLCFYALLFMIVPALRLLYTFEKNRMVRKKNLRARLYENSLSSPTAQLAQRLEEAEEMRAALAINGDSSIVYSTKTDYLEQISDIDFQQDLKLGGS
jgi:hypothetical protein